MVKITNVSSYTVKVPNYAQFAPWETREVTDQEAAELLKSEHFRAETPKKATDEVKTDEAETNVKEEAEKPSRSKK